jgi:hypothetical protein
MTIEEEVRFMLNVHEKYERNIIDKKKVETAFTETVKDMVVIRQISTVTCNVMGLIYDYKQLKSPPEVKIEYRESSSSGRC